MYFHKNTCIVSTQKKIVCVYKIPDTLLPNLPLNEIENVDGYSLPFVGSQQNYNYSEIDNNYLQLVYTSFGRITAVNTYL